MDGASNRLAPVLWVTPSADAGAATATGRFAKRLAARSDVIPVVLQVWAMPDPERHTLRTEVDPIARRIDELGQCHLLGFSVGATLALAATLARPRAFRSLTLLEPATRRLGRRGE